MGETRTQRMAGRGIRTWKVSGRRKNANGIKATGGSGKGGEWIGSPDGNGEEVRSGLGGCGRRYGTIISRSGDHGRQFGYFDGTEKFRREINGDKQCLRETTVDGKRQNNEKKNPVKEKKRFHGRVPPGRMLKVSAREAAAEGTAPPGGPAALSTKIVEVGQWLCVPPFRMVCPCQARCDVGRDELFHRSQTQWGMETSPEKNYL